MIEMAKAGRPRRADRRRKNQGNCMICGEGLDSRRAYCGPTCRQRAKRERDKLGLYGAS